MKNAFLLALALSALAGTFNPAWAAPAADRSTQLFVDGKAVAMPQTSATAPGQQSASRAQNALSLTITPIVIPPLAVPPVTVPPQCQNLPARSYCLCTGGQCKIISNP